MASDGGKFVYFLIGGFVGAAIGLLFAPKSGEEMRNLLENRYREGNDRLAQTARQGKDIITKKSRETADKVGQSIEKGKETLAQQKDRLSAAIEAGKQTFQQEKQKLSESEEKTEGSVS